MPEDHHSVANLDRMSQIDRPPGLDLDGDRLRTELDQHADLIAGGIAPEAEVRFLAAMEDILEKLRSCDGAADPRKATQT